MTGIEPPSSIPWGARSWPSWVAVIPILLFGIMCAPYAVDAGFAPEQHQIKIATNFWCNHGEPPYSIDLVPSIPYAEMMNTPIGEWDVSKVYSYRYLFRAGRAAEDNRVMPADCNPPIGNWTLNHEMTDLHYFALGNTAFNQDLSKWDVSSVTDMFGAFANTVFNGDISTWDTSKVSDMNMVFQNGVFNQDISKWDTGKVTRMEGMFYSNHVFNQNLYWNTSRLTSMSGIFHDAVAFNGDISGWDVSRITSMSGTFSASSVPSSEYSGQDPANRIPNFNFGYLAFWDTSKASNSGLRGWFTPCPGGTPPMGSMYGTVTQRCPDYVDEDLCHPNPCNSGECTSEWDFADNKGAYSCNCSSAYTGVNCSIPIYSYGSTNTEDLSQCVGVHGANAGCGGLFICDIENFVPCANNSGPLVDGVVPNTNFTANLYHEFTTAATPIARLRSSPGNLTYVTSLSVPADEGLKHMTISSTVDVCSNGVQLLFSDGTTPASHIAVPFVSRSPPTEGGYYVCDADIDKKLTRSQLANTSDLQIWLVANQANVQIQIGYNQSRLVIPKDDKTFWRFSLQDFQTTTDGDGTRLSFDVAPIGYTDADFDSSACQTDLAALVPSIDSTQGCNLPLTPNPAVNGQITTLVYHMPRSKYAECATNLHVLVGQPVVFEGRFELPKMDGDCAYFQEQDASRAYRISMNTDLDNDVDVGLSQFSSEVTDVDVEQCPGSGMDYRTPKARLTFKVKVTHGGTMLSHTLDTGVLNPGADSVTLLANETNNCDDATKTCEYTLAGPCETLYQHYDIVSLENNCVFEASKFQSYDTTFKQTLDSGLVVNYPLTLETGAIASSFDQSACFKPTDTTVKDVTDDYVVSVKALNHKATGMDWSVTTNHALVWSDAIALQLVVSNLPYQAEVQITSLTIKVEETATEKPVGNPNGYTLTRDKKMRLMASPATNYHVEPHFCRYFDVTNLCSNFYDSGESPNRWNSYMSTIIPADYYHCSAVPGGSAEHDIDYITFSLDKWVPEDPPEVPLTVKLSVVGNIQACSPTGTPPTGTPPTGTPPTGTRRRSGSAKEIVTAEGTYTFNDNVNPPIFRFGSSDAAFARPFAAAVALVAASLAAMMM